MFLLKVKAITSLKIHTTASSCPRIRVHSETDSYSSPSLDPTSLCGFICPSFLLSYAWTTPPSGQLHRCGMKEGRQEGGRKEGRVEGREGGKERGKKGEMEGRKEEGRKGRRQNEGGERGREEGRLLQRKGGSEASGVFPSFENISPPFPLVPSHSIKGFVFSSLLEGFQ